MKTLGKGSLSSFFVVLTNIAWYVVALVLAVTVLFLIAGLQVGEQIMPRCPLRRGRSPRDHEDSRFVQCDPQAHPVRAPSLGIEEAHLQTHERR